MSMTLSLSRGLSCATLLDCRALLAVVMSTEAELNNFAVELDFSSLTESVDELRLGESVVAVDVEAKQKAVAADGLSPIVECRWGCNYCCW